IMYAPRSRDGGTAPTFLQRDRFSRFQPTYPYGPCTLQLRDPEQQMELNRESVRAPPNRTIFDSDLIDVSVFSGGPRPPSSNSGISASTCSSNRRMEGPPPAYSEVMGHCPGATLFHPQHSSTHRGSRLPLQRDGPGGHRAARPGQGQEAREPRLTCVHT
ncbi:hypothetical protein E2I00_007693, partial [Balaenoptera physalus]